MFERSYQRQVVGLNSETWQSFIDGIKETRVIGIKVASNTEFVVDPQEVFTQAEKHQLFDGSTSNLISFLRDYDFPLPEDNLIDRLKIVNQGDFIVLGVAGRSGPPGDSLGFRLPLRLCTVNADAVATRAVQSDVSYLDLICITGTHEIAHTLTYQESWKEFVQGFKPVDDGKIFRRDGLWTDRPPVYTPLGSGNPNPYFQSPRDRRTRALSVLMEGIMQHVIIPCLSDDQVKLLHRTHPYGENLKAVNILIDNIGDEPLIQATFAKHGLRSFYLAVEQKFGSGKFNRLLDVLGSRSKQPFSARLSSAGFV